MTRRSLNGVLSTKPPSNLAGKNPRKRLLQSSPTAKEGIKKAKDATRDELPGKKDIRGAKTGAKAKEEMTGGNQEPQQPGP